MLYSLFPSAHSIGLTVITIPGAEQFGANRSVCLICVILLTRPLACVSFTREPCELSPTASFGLYLHFYAQRVGLSETVLAEFARMNQSTLNKITNIARHGVSVDTLVCLCLALGLTEEEAMDLMARKERTFSPADHGTRPCWN